MLRLIFLQAVAPLILASEILVVVPLPARSHAMLFEPLIDKLAERGHSITYISSVPYKAKSPNVNQVLIPEADHSDDGAPPNFFDMRGMGMFTMAFVMPMMGGMIVNHTAQAPEFQAVLRNGIKYDVIICEAFLSEALAAGLTHTLKAPLIGYGTFMPSYWVNFWVGNPAPSSFIPDPFTSLPVQMDFWDRLINFAFTNFVEHWHNWWHIRNQDTIMRQAFGQDLPYVLDILKSTSILLVNDQPALSFPRPQVSNLISIGGLHVKPPKPLPKDLKKIMDDAKDGVIYFSLGSNLKSSDMDAKRIKMFLDAFSALKQTILWKFEVDLPNKPKNVITSDWLPQSDILAHPNLKLFITHGGLLSTTEAIDRGVPVVGIPIFGDQPMNMRQSVNTGVGLALDYDTLTTENILATVSEVLKNPKYKEAAMLRSKQLKDVPIAPIDLATFWVEYVIRNKGAPHLRSTSLDLAWYQLYQIDVMAFILVALVLIFCTIKCLVKGLFRKICSKKTAKDNKKKRN